MKAIGRSEASVMNRSELTRRLVGRLQHEEAVIGGIGHTHFDLWAAGQRPQNFYMLGSMGLAAPIALGVAMAQPQRRVFALEGDGSLLMQLGALGTIAGVAPKNLTVIVWDNGCYQITGSQPTMTSSHVDLVAIARACGLTCSTWAQDEAHFDALVGAALHSTKPMFIGVRTGNEPPAGVTERDANKIRNRFMEALSLDSATT
ncbi:thiamine pyrophosphate-dependent enzyme [Hydrogenophaga sp.]|uniref:thiamine pyrophosphate-dependent enzyme n=1 Tax=Hydrogenophaga sp. TaxID=1904254 RepID=UPI00271FC82B|nr:thiamine pyrophosphate-dependent enzyme [Hydrogenophaga sp.]MDO9436907.1 thiamine pyrophosphate-dependent enzyme [Hydrogenophaga sp.]